MKRAVPYVLTAAFLLPAVALAADEHQHHRGMAMQAQAEPAWVDGTVKRIDAAGGKLTLAHGPLENLGMPAMTMAFRVKEKSWLDKVKEGDRVRFVADYVNGGVMVVKFEPAH